MGTIRQRLLDYGFRSSQIDKLMKTGKLNTVHGNYTFSNVDGLRLNGKQKLTF